MTVFSSWRLVTFQWINWDQAHNPEAPSLLYKYNLTIGGQYELGRHFEN